MKLKYSIIIILAVVISIALGLFVGIKLSESKLDNPSTNKNQQEENKDSNSNKNENFTLEDAKKLMDQYWLEGICPGGYYISDLSSQKERALVSMNNIEPSGEISLNDIKNTKVYKEATNDDYLLEDELDNNFTVTYYSYDDLLASEEKLFGNKTIKKERIKSCTEWFYVEEYDAFIEFGGPWGCDCGGLKDGLLTVDTFELVKDQLKIYTTSTVIFWEETGEQDSIVKKEYIFKKYNNNYILEQANILS